MWTARKSGAPISFGNAVVGVDERLFSFGGDKQFDDEHEGLEGLMSVAILDTYNLEFEHIVYRHPFGVPIDRCETTAARYGNEIYLWGGRSQDGDVFHDSLLCFDTETLRWSVPTTTGDAPAARSEHGAGAVKHMMYIFGGKSSHGAYSNSDVYKLHLVTRVWTVVRATGADISGTHARVSVTIGDRIYVLDASIGSGYLTISYLDTVRETWVKMPTKAAPATRTGYCAWAYKGSIFMFGGSFLSAFSNELWRFSPEDNTWGLMRVGGTVPTPIGAVCCAIIGNKVYVFGGAMKGDHGFAMCNKNFHVFEYLPELQTLCIMKIYEHGLSPKWLPDRFWNEIRYMIAPKLEKIGSLSNNNNSSI